MIEAPNFILLACVATAIAIAAHRLRAPYTLSLLGAGLLLGELRLMRLPELTHDLLFAVFLPGLLFEAAYHLRLRELRASAVTIALLAVPGVAVAIGITAVVLVGAGRLLLGSAAPNWGMAFIVGGVLAATDPVAVTALFRRLAAPRRLEVLVESESLLNDGTSIVFLGLIVAVANGGVLAPTTLAWDFLRIAGGGAVIGAAIGFLCSRAIQTVDEPVIEITLTMIAAYASFSLAEQFHLSGVIATVTAGVVCGNYGHYVAMSPATRVAVNGFWAWMSFALNSAVFLLLGAAVRLQSIAGAWIPILLTVTALLVARTIVVSMTAAVVRRTEERIPVGWSAVLVWGGLRGALSLVLALALPAATPGRELIITITAGTVVLSLVGQGLTMPILLRRTGLVGSAPPTSSLQAEISS